MSFSRFNMLMRDAAINNRPNDMISVYNEWQLSHCYYPVSVPIFDAHKQQKRIIKVACGSCYHCIETKINEWCTRMYAHAEDFNNVYFVTLTYRSFYDVKLPLNRLILSKLEKAVWHRDSFNEYHRLCYSPCLLVKKHYQDFLKRLRKNTGLSDLTYVLSGEYGTKYGRPHFHMVLFTNGVLKKSDIVRAWSVALWRTDAGLFVPRRNQKYNGQSYDFPIGRVDFNDLVSNGTFNTTAKIRVDGTYMNAANCFAYVCKYVCKRDHANLNRVRLAFHSLFHKQSFVKLYSNEVEFSHIADYLNSCGYSYKQINDSQTNLKRYTYEKNVFSPSELLFNDSLSSHYQTKIFGKICNLEFYPSYYVDFRDSFSPFCEFSRSTPIGSVYANRHIEELAQGVFNRPLLQTESFVVPSYFRRKASNFLYRLRKRKSSLFCKSYNLGPLIELDRHFKEYIDLPSSIPEYLGDQVSFMDVTKALQSDFFHFADAYTGERIVLYANKANYFKYSRHDRLYVKTKCIPLSLWIKSVVSDLSFEFSRHDLKLRISEENERLSNDALSLMEEFHGDFRRYRDSFVNSQNHYLSDRQKIYNELHQSAE